MDKRGVGAVYEKRTAEYLTRQGYRILERNFRSRFGEIDIIARKGGYLVFVEVKYRGGNQYGSPSEAVDRKKQKRICNTASYYLYSRRYPPDTPCRFDVAAVSAQEIRLIENAFPYVGDFAG